MCNADEDDTVSIEARRNRRAFIELVENPEVSPISKRIGIIFFIIFTFNLVVSVSFVLGNYFVTLFKIIFYGKIFLPSLKSKSY